MCGIAGIIDFKARPIDREPLAAARAMLTHRGPDDAGLWQHAGPTLSVGLAHTRLAVIDPDPRANQPMTTPDRQAVLAYNGELYNYRDLQRELAGPWRTTSDTEVVLQAIRQWGPRAEPRFDGMWTLAYFDVAARAGHLSRDPFGIKPLYYAVADDRLLFASELRALCRLPGVPTEIDRQAMAWYLNLGFVPHPRTIYRDVWKLPPGAQLAFDARGVQAPQHVGLFPTDLTPVPDYPTACAEVRRRIERVVARQRVADVPVGAFLSGGLDSSVIVAALAAAGGSRVRTFSIGYPEHPRYDESPHARQVAAHFGTEHETFAVGFGEMISQVEPMLDHLGEPFADSSLLPTSLVSRATRRHVTVALSGDGGDELFGGYWRYMGHTYLERYRRWPWLLRKGLIEPIVRALPAGRSTRWLDRIRQVRKLIRADSVDALARHVTWARFLDDSVVAALGLADVDPALGETLLGMYREAARRWMPGSAVRGLDEVLRADLAITLPGDMLFKVDTASMYHSLEVRVPFLSPDVANFVAALPIDYRVRGKQTKRVLRDAFADVLPAEVLRRPKMGFEVPVGEFLRAELEPMFRDVVTDNVLRELGLNATVVRRWQQEHNARRADRTEILWSIFMLCGWKQRVHDRRSA